MVVLRALGRCWGELSDDGRFLEVRRADTRVARIDLVLSAKLGRPVLVRPAKSEGDSTHTATAPNETSEQQ